MWRAGSEALNVIRSRNGDWVAVQCLVRASQGRGRRARSRRPASPVCPPYALETTGFGVISRRSHMTFKILSIDGGGIRGIIPAIVLEELERTTGKPISTLFDLIAGTSTGGILALGLTRPGPDGAAKYSAGDLVGLYRREGQRIFSRSLLYRVTALGRLSKPKYPTLSANVRETRSTQRIRVGRRQRKRTCWDCEREWKRMVVPLEPGRPSEARQLLRTRR